MKKKFGARVLLGVCLAQMMLAGASLVRAAGTTVVMNEVAWAGSADSANDEWIELYNTTGSAVDLSGWTISDDQGVSTYALAGAIGANSYYVIEDSEAVVQPRTADVIINLSLANSGDSLVLFDANGQMVDSVNGSGGMWYAGSVTTHASMERINPAASGDDATNWAASTGAGSTATSSGGTHIVGTPGVVNSVNGSVQTTQQSTQQSSSQVSILLSSAVPMVGQTLTATVHVQDAAELFSYGVDLTYDPAVLTYRSVHQGEFLNAAGTVNTSFQAGLENGQSGKLVVAEARTVANKTGVSGSGDLFTLMFDVVGGAGSQSSLNVGSSGFLADVNGSSPSTLSGATFVPAVGTANPVTVLQADEGDERYSLELTWSAPVGGADAYKVYRQNPHGVWVELGQTTLLNFIDSDAIASGGKIIPNLDYHYRVTALKGSVESAPAETVGGDTRGLKGDNNRSDRVDGVDLDRLARHFTQTDSVMTFDPLVDTSYDGQVDGNDLIDIGANFAKTYS